MKDPSQPVELRAHAERGLTHIANSVDRGRECRPYFRFNLTNRPVWAQHEGADTPHTVGRFLHALNVCADIAGVPDDAELSRGLRKQLLDSLGHGDKFGWADMGYEPSPPLAGMHDQREVLLGLIAIWELSADSRARRCAGDLVRAMDKATRATGTYPAGALGPNGWQDANSGTSTSQRAIAALLAYSRTFDDPLGVDLALRFGQHALSISFGPGGELTRACGTHIHSITGTVASLVELGLVAAENAFIERARLIFDSGLLPYRTRTGWVKESATTRRGRGEANCTSDLIEAACLLGEAGYPSYFQDADRMLRNHLLASQMDDLSWVQENEGMTNTQTRAYDGLRHRVHGAFCFAEPNGFHSYNSDLTGAALQGIAAAWRHIITTEAAGTVRINFLLSREHEALRLTSKLPQEGTVIVEPERPIARLLVLVPCWCEQASIAATVNGKPMPTVFLDDDLLVEHLDRGSRLEIHFEQPRFTTIERAMGYETPYRIQWIGNTVTAMSGGGERTALYPPL